MYILIHFFESVVSLNHIIISLFYDHDTAIKCNLSYNHYSQFLCCYTALTFITVVTKSPKWILFKPLQFSINFIISLPPILLGPFIRLVLYIPSVCMIVSTFCANYISSASLSSLTVASILFKKENVFLYFYNEKNSTLTLLSNFADFQGFNLWFVYCSTYCI